MKSLLVLLIALVACAGPQAEESAKPVTGPSAMPPPRPPASGDVSVEIPVIEIKSSLIEPEALGQPGVPIVDPKRPIRARIGSEEWAKEVARQRAQVQAAKDPVVKQAQAAILATMLYRESKMKPTKAEEKPVLSDARQVLRDVAQQVGDKAVDELTLRLLGSYELLMEDYPAAEKAWQAFIDKDNDPKNKDPKKKDKDKDTEGPYNRAFLGYSQLKQFKNAEALAAVASEKLDEKQPELAYVMAWAKWRNGDGAGAWQAITTAAKGWGANTGREELEREILLFAARTNVSFDQALAVITTVIAKPATPQPADVARVKIQQYDLIARLALAGYGNAGRWTDGIAALSKAVEVAGDAVPPNDRTVIYYQQADFSVPLDAPDAAAGYAKKTIEAIAACGAKCPDKDKSDMIQRLNQLGRLFHILYATANDRRYYEPAKELYGMTIPLLDPAARPQAQKDAKTLETTFKNIKAGTGTHDKGALENLFRRHNPEVESCYQVGLANPKLGGTVTLHIESDATGVIKGVASEPKAGAGQLSAVAGCVVERVKTWKLPKRGMPGNTRIKMSYALSLKK